MLTTSVPVFFNCDNVTSISIFAIFGKCAYALCYALRIYKGTILNDHLNTVSPPLIEKLVTIGELCWGQLSGGRVLAQSQLESTAGLQLGLVTTSH